MQQVLCCNELYDKPFLYDFFRLGNGILTERSGERWLQARKLVNPAFNTRMLTAFLPIMDSEAKNLCDKLEPLADGNTEIDIFSHLSSCTLSTTFGTTMGQNAKEIPEQHDYIRNVEIFLKAVGERLVNVYYFIEPIYKLSKAYKIHDEARRICNEFTHRIVSKRRFEIQSLGEDFQQKDEYIKQHLNALDQIITMKRPDGTGFSDPEVNEHLYTLIGAGTDTSALTVAYTCLYLAMYPEVQEKVLTEINQVFYSPEVEVNIENLKQLEYTEMVIKEILRLFPAGPLGARQTMSAIELDGIRIPKDQIIIFSMFTLHRRKDIWGPDPEQFDPERFRPEAIEARHPFAYLPFSGGLRNCIGHRYAMNVMRIILLRIMQKFEIQTNMKPTDLKLKFEVTLKLDGPHRVWLVRRNK
ncbi:AAEL015361-PA [Aedes aegypti]|uniref:AAEL015361-PA n=1 Tax=Aedes aegypti TaxID=7159 RepID=Q16E72_AEDAE|nr:AAEL015361-PA [Aedes aegypti]